MIWHISFKSCLDKLSAQTPGHLILGRLEFALFLFQGSLYGGGACRPQSPWPSAEAFAFSLNKKERRSFGGKRNIRTWVPIRSVLWRTFLNGCCPGTMVPLDCSHHFGLNLPLMCCCSTHILSFLLPYYVVAICQFPLFHVQNICSFANISLCFPTWWFIYTHRTRLCLLLLFMQYGRCGGAGIITVLAINNNTSVMIMSLFTSELRKVRLVNSSPYFFQMCIVYVYT